MKIFKTSLLVTFLFISFSCINCSSFQNNLEVTKYKNPNLPVTSFMKMLHISNATICNPFKPTECEKDTFKASGSGTIIAKGPMGNGFYVLTAGHVCAKPEVPADLKEFITLNDYLVSYDINLKEYPLSIVFEDDRNDICVLYSEKTIDYPTVNIADQQVKIGERIFNIAAPGGFMGKFVVPIYEGFYSGLMPKSSFPTSENEYEDVYSLQGYPGSSGSMILNFDGEIVGILCKGFREMNTIVFSPPYKILKQSVELAIKNNNFRLTGLK